MVAPKLRSLSIAVLVSAACAACVEITSVAPDPAQPGDHVLVGVSNILGPSFLEPGARLRFDGTTRSLSPDTSSQVGFNLPAATSPGSHLIEVEDQIGLIEILTVIYLFRDHDDSRILEVTAPPRVVNMIPASLSGETNQDSEPFLSIRPRNPALLVGSAFTPNPNGAGSVTAPIFVSTNGGNTWSLVNSVPSQVQTGDITHAFDGDGPVRGTLYAGILRRPAAAGSTTTLDELSIDDVTSAGPMTLLSSNQNTDQPFVTVATVGGRDRVYVGNNEAFDAAVRPNTATIDLSLDSGATWNSVRLESRVTFNQDAPSVRASVARDGVVYAAYLHRTNAAGVNRTTDVVVARDDAGATGATPFQNLLDGGDGLAGQRVVIGVNIPFINAATLGFERIGSTLSLAVAPRQSSTVYVAWCDRVGNGDIYTMHVRRSIDSGQNWSNDLRTITNATNTALAIADDGAVGFLYQQLTNAGAANARWVTHLEQSRDAFVNVQDTVLATTPANAPASLGLPYLGDYTYLIAQGSAFRGVFSANNTPDVANFPQGVVYQRSSNFTTNTLDDGARNPVAISIDPFYFSVQVMP